tara:strand:- start:387 stop:923 length:537 start_codon:yes stop_codon:yes gene_type:complete
MADKAPFHIIPDSPDTISCVNIITRMLQGLGFRYHWATKGLRNEDLDYRPADSAKNCLETLKHIYILVEIINAATQNKISVRPAPIENIPNEFEILREITLNRIKESCVLFESMTLDELGLLKIKFNRGGVFSEFPVWNLINGPISDAIYHVGQIVSFRRTSGNPIEKGVNVFLGEKR